MTELYCLMRGVIEILCILVESSKTKSMKRKTTPLLVRILMISSLLFFCQTIQSQEQKFTTPESYFGFIPGADHELFDYEQLIGYLQELDAQSSRLEMRQIGESPQGRPMYIAFISSEKNLQNLDQLREINENLAINPQLTDSEVDQMVAQGKVFFLATLSMHSSEVGPSQSAPLIAYDLVTTEDTEKLKWLDDVVYMMNPCHNPDGMNMIVNHYQKYKGTKYDDSRMPGIYHEYVGHDNNRDFITLTQSDTKAISDLTSKTWFPQVMVEKHQMGGSGVRYFVPPNHDPIAENIDAGIWNWNGIFGTNMIKDLTKEGCSGVAQRYIFDNYWPGSTETCLWKNVMAFLTEAASCNYAKPIYIEAGELNAWGKGLSEYKKSTNFPDPWPGGWWRLSDIIKYEIVSTNSCINTCSMNKEEILRFRNDICKSEVEKGRTEAPYYYILPFEQHDRGEWFDLAELLIEHGIKVYTLDEDILIDHKNYNAGSMVVPMAQPFRPFIKEVMEVQEYPVRHYTPDGDIIKPYDIATWSLPLHKGVACDEIDTRSEELEKVLVEWYPSDKTGMEIEDAKAAILDVNCNDSYRVLFTALNNGLKISRLKSDLIINNDVNIKGAFVLFLDRKKDDEILTELLKTINCNVTLLSETDEIELTEISLPRVALVESWFHDMDAGWTRYLFDEYGIQYTVLHPGDFEKTDLEKDFDVLVFPSENKDILLKGKYKRSGGTYSPSSYPPEFTKGIGEKGLEKILKYIDKGGNVIAWGESPGLFVGPQKIKWSDDEIEEFTLPVNDVASVLTKKGLYCPGSLVNVQLKQDHPLTMGMEKNIGVFYRGNPVFTTREPYFDMDRRVIATFPEKNILASGYIENEELLGRKAGMVWLKKGKGQMVLFAFLPQFRASTPVSYKLLFNALLLPPVE